MEVDVDGSFSYPEPQNNAKDNSKWFSVCSGSIFLFSI